MTLEQTRDAVDAFFGRWGGASLKLPSGWFGRPHDNFHELTATFVIGDALVVVLDERLELRLHNPQVARLDGSILRVEGFTQVDWTWYDYDADAEHRERFDGGTVEFVAN